MASVMDLFVQEIARLPDIQETEGDRFGERSFRVGGSFCTSTGIQRCISCFRRKSRPRPLRVGKLISTPTPLGAAWWNCTCARRISSREPWGSQRNLTTTCGE